MDLVDPLNDLLQNRSFVRTLRALEGLPQGMEVSTREIARRAGISHPTAADVLHRLLEQGVVLVRRSLWADEYHLNRKHVAIAQLNQLFRWERAIPESLRASLATGIQRRAPWVTAAYLFGSAVRGNMNPNSDLDVALICPSAGQTDRTQRVMEELSEATQERYGNRVSAVVGTGSFDRLSRSTSPGHTLWRRIRKDGVLLFAKPTKREPGGSKS